VFASTSFALPRSIFAMIAHPVECIDGGAAEHRATVQDCAGGLRMINDHSCVSYTRLTGAGVAVVARG
jgi:hypothetical protein